MRSFFKSLLPRFLTYDQGIIEEEEEEKNQKYDEPIQNQTQTKTNSKKNENILDSQTKPPLKTDQNMKLNQSELDILIEKGNLGIELFKQQKYQKSKDILVPCCENLLKIYQASKNIAVKNYLVTLLKFSEECQKCLVIY